MYIISPESINKNNSIYTSTTTLSNSYTPTSAFKQGIRRDPTLFPKFKDSKFWDNFKRSLLATARAQDVEDILDPNFIPTDMDLFNEQQKYMYSVFEKTLLTDQAKAFVREHENDFDAQKVYSKTLTHYTKSTRAMLDKSQLLSYITSARIGASNWKGTTEGFIIHWEEQMRLYETLSETTEHFSDSQKKIMLENTVSPVK